MSCLWDGAYKISIKKVVSEVVPTLAIWMVLEFSLIIQVVISVSNVL